MLMNKTALLNNRYQLLETIGRGGFGQTYLAIDTHLPSQKKCVIKQLKPIIHEPQIPVWMQERFQQEARILEHLGAQSPQIPGLYAYFSEGGNFYLVQEWIEGITLTQKVEQEGNLSAQEVKKILISLLSVLEKVHNQRIIHRDIKPDNIILRAGDELPILIDFGAVKEAMATAMTYNGNSAYSIAIGTAGYMASEQAAGRPIYSSDLYSLGLTAVYLLTGKSPQYLTTDSRSGEILWRKAAPEIHSNLATVLDRAIRFHPKDRFSSAPEMLKALQASQSFSRTPTVAGGSQIANPSQVNDKVNSKFSQKKTVAVNYPPAKEKDHHWFPPFLPLLMLSGVALASFVVGFNLLLDREKTDDPDVAIQPNEPIIPSENNNSKPQEKPKTETPDPPLDSLEETKPPEIIVDSPSPSIPSPSIPLPEVTLPSPTESNPPSSENQNVSSSIPIVVLGTSEAQLLEKLGKPTSQSKGYWKDSVALLYKNIDSNQADLGYILHKDTREILQTEVSFNPSEDLSVMENTLNGLLKGNLPQPVKQALQEVYQRQTDLRSFNLGDVKGMIQRNQQERIYIGIWKGDFH
jgi:serine/threonine-protein kinase